MFNGGGISGDILASLGFLSHGAGTLFLPPRFIYHTHAQDPLSESTGKINEPRRFFARHPAQQTRSSGSGNAGRAGRGSARSDLQAEAYADWPCVRCTFINAYTEDACGGCGGANKKRDRLLRERREEAEKLGRLQTARRCRDRRV